MIDAKPIAVVGGGPSGLSAAMTLARAGLRSIIIDTPGQPRNASSPGVSNLPGHDGVTPANLRARIRGEVEAYGQTQFVTADVQHIESSTEDAAFALTLSDGALLHTDHVILACGRVNQYPDVHGFGTYWCKSIHHCPYCGGYDLRGTPWGIIVNRPEMVDIVEVYRLWSNDLIVFLAPGIEMSVERQQDLAAKGIGVEHVPIRKILGDGNHMTAVELEDGRQIARTLLNWWPHMALPPVVSQLDLALTGDGDVEIDAGFHTSQAGTYATGDLTYSNHQTTATALHLGGACAASVAFDIAMASSS